MLALLLSGLIDTGAIDRAVRLVMRTQRVAGASIGISRSGRVLYERGYGWSDLGRRLPARAGTVYRIGSLTKAFTARAIAQLAAQGKLSLQDRVSREIALPWPSDATVEQLLEQRSGIRSYSDDPALDPHAAYSPAQLIEALAAEPPDALPGTQFEYSNTNYVLLGMIVERVSGAPYGSFLQRAVIDPLGLQQTRYGDRAGEARGYARDALNVPVPPSSVSYGFSAAGMTSNVPDLLRWLETIRPPYYGFLSSDMYGYSVRYARGSVPGYSAFEMLSPQTGEEIVILTNAGNLDPAPLAKSLFAAIERPSPAFRVRTLVEQLQAATLDRSSLTPHYARELPEEQVREWQAHLAPLGEIADVAAAGREPGAGCTNERYRVTFLSGGPIALQICLTRTGSIDAIAITGP